MNKRDKDWYKRRAKSLLKQGRAHHKEDLERELMIAGQSEGKPYDADVIAQAADRALHPDLHKRPKQGYGWG